MRKKTDSRVKKDGALLAKKFLVNITKIAYVPTVVFKEQSQKLERL